MVVVKLAAHHILVALILGIKSSNVANVWLVHARGRIRLILGPVVVSGRLQLALLGAETAGDELAHRRVHGVRGAQDQLGLLAGAHLGELGTGQV